jgi:hypothetical protein
MAAINPASAPGGAISEKKQIKALLDAIAKEDVRAVEASIAAGANVNYGHPDVVSEEMD